MESLISQISQGLANFDDVSEVRSLLTRMKMPMELVDSVMDYAEYWSHTTAQTYQPHDVHQGRLRRIRGNDGNCLMLRTPPIGFSKDSEDQRFWETKPPMEPAPPAMPDETFKEMDSLSPEIKAKLPSLVHPVRKIVFTITSHDQGWASGESDPNSEYGHSWTWFDVGLERFSTTPCAACAAAECPHTEAYKWAPEMSFCNARTVLPGPAEPDQDGTVGLAHTDSPGDRALQINKRADRNSRTHTVVWNWDDGIEPGSARADDELVKRGRGRATAQGEFVRSLKAGDMITVWAKARFPGWANHVDSIKVDVYWVN